MKVFVTDTESTGLPDWHAPSESEHQPHLCEIAAILLDDDTGEVLAAFDTLIKPDGWVILPEMTEIHGITMERAMAEGIPEKLALEQAIALWRQADRRVCHNEVFDARMYRIGIKRFWPGTPEEVDAFAEEWSKAERYCTMRTSTKRATGRKFQKLTEAHEHFVGKPLEGAHEALYDALGCARLYMMLEKGYVPDSLWDVDSLPMINVTA